MPRDPAHGFAQFSPSSSSLFWGTSKTSGMNVQVRLLVANLSELLTFLSETTKRHLGPRAGPMKVCHSSALRLWPCRAGLRDASWEDTVRISFVAGTTLLTEQRATWSCHLRTPPGQSCACQAPGPASSHGNVGWTVLKTHQETQGP